jgi:hypothetical protein
MKGFDKSCRSDENGRIKKQHILLSSANRDYLDAPTRRGERSAKVYRRVPTLLELDCGKT